MHNQSLGCTGTQGLAQPQRGGLIGQTKMLCHGCARKSDQAVGRRTRLSGGRYRRRRPVRGRRPARRVAWDGMARRDGLYGAPRRASLAAGGSRSRHSAGAFLPHELSGGHSGKRRARVAGSIPGLHRALRPRPRLPQGDARSPAKAVRAHRGGSGAVQPPCLRRFSAGDGSGTRGSGGHRLARQAHVAARSPGFLVFPRRNLLRPGAGNGCAHREPLRYLPQMHRHLPDPGDHRALPVGRAALHLLPDDRIEGRDTGRPAPADRQPCLRLRRLPAGLPLERVCADLGGIGFPGAQRPGPREHAGTLFLDRGGFWPQAAGLADPANRVRALVAESCGRVGQRSDFPGGDSFT